MAPKERQDAEVRQPLLGGSGSGNGRESSDDRADSPDAQTQVNNNNNSINAWLGLGSTSDTELRSRFHRIVAGVTAVLVLLLAVNTVRARSSGPPGPAIHITQTAFTDGLASCRAIRTASVDAAGVFRKGGAPQTRPSGNPRHTALASLTNNSTPLLLKHATIWDGVGSRLQNTDVAIANGLIVRIGSNLTPRDLLQAASAYSSQRHSTSFSTFKEDDVEVVDVQGRVVSPGLVDMHSHATIMAVPGFWGDEDGNEMAGGPTNPYLRVLDGVNALDAAIEYIAAGGVTTSLIIPGSGTLMGGEGVAIKHLTTTKTGSNSADTLTLNFGMDPKGSDGKLWRWMKMACGENPKRAFGGRGIMPGSRMGSGWLFRQRFEAARSALRAQDDWCESAESVSRQFGENNAHRFVAHRFPDALEYESLVALLRKDIRLQVHCYQVNDLDMMIRNSHEFDFPIIAFHHATEAHLLASKLAAENISAAVFADHSLYKREAYKHSVRAGQILTAAGAKVAYKSDHPVLNAQHLIYEAQKSAHYGLDEDTAFAAVTSVPADRIGAGWRIGRIAEGYDADVLVWDRPPLTLGAHPLRVIIDGYTVKSDPLTPQRPPQIAPAAPITPVLDASHTRLSAYTVVNVSGIYTQPSEILKGSILVENGVVTCVGAKCATKGTVFDLNGGVVIPGLVGVAVPLGLEEISAESGTADGQGGVADAISGLVHARDGLRVGGGGKLLEYAWKSGVLAAVAAPSGSGLVQGVSVAFRTAAQRYSDAILKDDVALHITIGNEAKNTYANSISSQFAHIRKLLTSQDSPDSPFAKVVAGKLALVASVNDPNDISKLLALILSTAPKARLIVATNSGAVNVANELAKAGVPVLLQPPRCQQKSWEERWCRPYGVSGKSTYELLKSAGVKVLISISEPDQIRSLLFEAGWGTVGDSDVGGGSGVNVNAIDAVGVVTWNVADAFGLEGVGRIEVGKKATFVGLDGGPVGFGYKIQILADNDEVTTHPIQN
ncbi:hypothetical protein HK100_010684 [Physocladia obscura]|uniref:Amidohydrolase-related domain-containing protein n=1 Tax=Physocladia obscura TaxID=109957 RepID=A0AAD5TAV8_9FUNG|nr:hypothetical protein HK100_010684 [Physocladia obscura]